MAFKKNVLNWFITGKWFSKHKFWEIQSATFNDIDYGITLRRRKECDHAGTRLEIEFYKWYFCAQVYDSRHWNEATNDFMDDYDKN